MNMQRVQEIGLKIKGLADVALHDWGLFIIVLLATAGAFGLGRLSALETARPLVSVSEAPEKASLAPLMQGGMVIASRTGSTYYFPWCTSAAKILPANQRIFASAAAAQKAGLRAAKNCKGLE